MEAKGLGELARGEGMPAAVNAGSFFAVGDLAVLICAAETMRS